MKTNEELNTQVLEIQRITDEAIGIVQHSSEKIALSQKIAQDSINLCFHVLEELCQANITIKFLQNRIKLYEEKLAKKN